MSNRAKREGVVKYGLDARKLHKRHLLAGDALAAREFWYPSGIVWTAIAMARADDGFGFSTPKKASAYFHDLCKSCANHRANAWL